MAEKIEKNIQELTNAIDKTYGKTWAIMWRNFTAGIFRALGATVGYVLFIGLAVVIAQKLGVFQIIQDSWNSFMDKLPINQAQELQIDQEMMERYYK